MTDDRPSVAEIVRRVRRIQITARRVVDDLLSGAYHSVFRGRGMEFDEVREYQPGDEVRTIDWNVTARAGVPFVKRFREERELTVLFAVDVSASHAFGSRDRSKLELLTEVAALLMFSALQNHDKVGLVTFADDVVRFVPPRKGKGAVLRLVRELVAVEPIARPARLEPALQFVRRVQRRRAVVFVLGDFLGGDPSGALQLLNARHDVVAIVVADPREAELPPGDFLRARDPETGATVEVDLRSARVRRAYAEAAARRAAELDRAFRRAGVDALRLRVGEPYVPEMQRFFRMRERRMR